MDNYVDINGYDGYKINEKGEIISYKRVHPKKIKPYVAGNGYWEVTLSPTKGKYKRLGLHRLLAETFIERPPHTEVVNHKNGNTLDYRLENLEWVTKSENKIHSIYELKKNVPLPKEQ